MAIPKKIRAPTRTCTSAKPRHHASLTSDIWTNSFVIATATPPLKPTAPHGKGTVVCRSTFHTGLAIGDRTGIQSPTATMSKSKTPSKMPLQELKNTPAKGKKTGPKTTSAEAYPVALNHGSVCGDDTIQHRRSPLDIQSQATANLLSTLSSLELQNRQLQAHTSDGANKLRAWKDHVHELGEAISDRNFQIADKNSSELIRLKHLYNESLGVYERKLTPLKVESEDLRWFVENAKEVIQWKGRENEWAAVVKGFLWEVREGKRELLELEKECEPFAEVAKMREELGELRARIVEVKQEGLGLDDELQALRKGSE